MSNGDWQPLSEVPPPTEFTGMPDKPSTWPTVIGVIGIILASLGLVCSCPSLFATQLYQWLVDMQAQSGEADPMMEAQLQAMRQFQVWTMALTVAGLGAGVWLLVGSIGLARRRPGAGRSMLGWSMLNLVLVLFNLAMQFLMTQSMVNLLTQEGHGDRAGEAWAGAAIGGCFVLILGLGWTLFVMIWFSRAKIKNEIGTWR